MHLRISIVITGQTNMNEYTETITQSGTVIREIVSMPPVAPIPVIDPCLHLIDIGPAEALGIQDSWRFEPNALASMLRGRE